MGRFDGRVAVVTGGRTGIGRAIAVKLQQGGARVLTVQRSADEDFEHVLADLGNPAECDRIIEDVTRIAGRLDMLVNCAGVMDSVSTEERTLDRWNHTLAVNLTTPFMLIRAALPLLLEARGSVVNIGSIEGLGANPHHSAYAASKAGLHALTRAIALDHGNQGIRCNAVAPGWIETNLNKGFGTSDDGQQRFDEALRSLHPIGRTGQPEDVASLVAWLASDEASFVTGHTWAVDGGRMSKLSLPA